MAAPSLHRVDDAGWVWYLTPAGRSLYGDAAPDHGPIPGAVVKRNLQRTISRVDLPDGVVYVKECRPNTPRAWLRELVRRPKAQLEFDNALALIARGIPTIEPLAWGGPAGRWPAESILITRGADAVPLPDVFDWPMRLDERFALTDRLAAFVASLHASGVTHPDPHPGNFLYTPGRTLLLIDVHDVRFGPSLSAKATTDNLVLFNRYFQMRVGRTDRLRFWRRYHAARPEVRRATEPRQVEWVASDSGYSDRLARRIEVETAGSNRRFWLARQKRHLSDNRDTHRVTGPAATGWAARDLPADLVAGWLTDPDAPFRQTGAKLLKDSRTSSVARVDTPAGPLAYKRFNLKSLLLPLKALGRRPPAVRSWLAGLGLLDRGLPTARPLACFQRHRFGLPTVGYLVCEWVPDAVELPAAVAGMTPREKWAFVHELGRTLRLFHERDLRHRDLKAANVLVAGGRPVLVDLVGVTAWAGAHGFSGLRDLARLARDFVGSPHVSNTDRLRFLLAYAGPMHVPRYVRRLWVRRGWHGIARWV